MTTRGGRRKIVAPPHDGTPVGLLFPASMAVADGRRYVTNLALPLTNAEGDEPEEDVAHWTVSRLRLPR